jgi:hypothetical protein
MLPVSAPSSPASDLPGIVSRRVALAGSAAAMVALLGARARGQEPSPGRKRGDRALDEFVAAVLPLAQQVRADDRRDEDAYLFAAAGAALRLHELPPGEFAPVPDLPGTETAPLLRRAPLTIMLVKVAPGARIPLHDHGGTLGLVVGLQGELRVRNFELAGAADRVPQPGGFRLRQTTDDLITPGRVSTLGSVRDNFHDVVAGPEGALVFDMFTVVRRGVGSRFYRLADVPVDAARREWTAEPA